MGSIIFFYFIYFFYPTAILRRTAENKRMDNKVENTVVKYKKQKRLLMVRVILVDFVKRDRLSEI